MGVWGCCKEALHEEDQLRGPWVLKSAGDRFALQDMPQADAQSTGKLKLLFERCQVLHFKHSSTL